MQSGIRKTFKKSEGKLARQGQGIHRIKSAVKPNQPIDTKRTSRSGLPPIMKRDTA
jgi:hypothetical protein